MAGNPNVNCTLGNSEIALKEAVAGLPPNRQLLLCPVKDIVIGVPVIVPGATGVPMLVEDYTIVVDDEVVEEEHDTLEKSKVYNKL